MTLKRKHVDQILELFEIMIRHEFVKPYTARVPSGHLVKLENNEALVVFQNGRVSEFYRDLTDFKRAYEIEVFG